MASMRSSVSTVVLSLISATVAAQQSATVKPFTATYTIAYYSPENKLARQTLSTVARKNNGSTYLRNQDAYPSPGAHSIVEIIDTDAGTHVVLDPATKSKITFHIGVSNAQQLAYGSDDDACPADLDATQKTAQMFGYNTFHHVERLEKTGTLEKWVIPDLLCFPAVEISTPAAGKSPHNEQRLTSLSGEVSSGLFFPPADFVERSPMTVETLHRRDYSGEPFVGDGIARRLDTEYFQSTE